MAFGYEEKTSFNAEDFVDGEIVEVMLLGWHYSANYLKELKAKNEKEKEAIELYGGEFKPVKANVKDGGMVWDYAIIKRGRGEGVPKEWIFGSDADDLQDPGYISFGSINVDTPAKMQEQKFSQQCKVGGDKLYRGNVFIKNDFPATSSDVFIDGFPVRYEDIADKVEDITPYEIREQERLNQWEAINEVFAGMNEEQVIKALNDNTSRRFLMCNIVQQRPVYITPCKGVKFRAAISLSNRGYKNLIVFKFIKMDNGKYGTAYYTNYDTGEPNEDDMAYADALLKLRARIKREAEAKKKAIEEAKKSENYSEFIEEDLEEAPF